MSAARPGGAGPIAAALLAAALLACGEAPAPAAPGTPADDGGMPVAARDTPQWREQHARHVAQAKAGGHDVLFLGDSLTFLWLSPAGKALWTRHVVPLKAANFGIGGDACGHLLWRLRNGALDGPAPKVVVLLIGTNDLKGGEVRTAPEAVGARVAAVLRELRTRLPAVPVLLHTIPPRQPAKYDWIAQAVDAANERIRALADGEKVRLVDLAKRMRGPDGAFAPELYVGDQLHFSEAGYRAWWEVLEAPLRQALGGG